MNQPAASLTRESRVDAAIAEFLIARESGAPFDRADWLARHAEMGDELRDFLADEDHVGGILAPLHQNLSTPGPALHTDPNATRTHGGSGDTTTTAPRIEHIGDYEILEEIARGGMGVVFKARQKSLNRIVALKMVLGNRLASQKDIERFQREAEAAAGLDHPNIVPIYEVGTIEGLPFFSMKLIDGGSLTDRREQFQNNPRHVARLMATVAKAVHHAHQRGILHRDLKPSNVLLDTYGEPHVADFGLAKRLEDASNPNSDNTQTGAIVGTPSFMAPEQARGHSKQLTTAVDVYGLGAVLYDLLAGQPPFRANSPAETLLLVLGQEAERPSQLRSGVPRDLETICLKCLEKESGKRYASAEALAEDLERWLKGVPVRARTASAPERLFKWIRRKPSYAALVILSTLVLLALVGGTVAFAYNSRLERKNRDLDRAVLSAEEQREEAKLQRARAESSEAEVRRVLYMARMNQANQAFKDGQIGRAVQLLEEYRHVSEEDDPRGFEWHYLMRRCGGARHVCNAHPGGLTGLSIHPNSERLATTGADGQLIIWEIATGRELRRFRLPSQNSKGVEYLKGSRWVAIALNGPSEIRIVDEETGECSRSIRLDAELTKFTASEDGRVVAAAGKDGTVAVYDVASGDRLFNQRLHQQEVTCLAFSPDGKWITSASRDENIIVWDWSAGKEIWVVPNTQHATDLAFSPDGRRLSATGFQKTDYVHVFEIGVVNSVITKQVRRASFEGVRYLREGKRIVTAGKDDSLYLIDAGKAIRSLSPNEEPKWPALHGHRGPVRKLATSRDSRWLVSGGIDVTNPSKLSEIRFWELQADPRPLRIDVGMSDERPAPVVSSDARFAFTAELKNDEPCICAHDLTTGAECWRIAVPDRPQAMACNPDGKFLALGLEKEVIVVAADSGGIVARIPTAGAVHHFDFGPKSAVLALWTGTQIKVIDWRSGHCIRDWKYDVVVYDLKMSPDGKRIAVAAHDGFERIFDLKTGTRTEWQTEYNETDNRRINWSPDGKRLAIQHYQQMSVWDVDLQRRIWSVQSDDIEPFQFVQFSADGSRIVSGDPYEGRVRLHDARTGLELLDVIVEGFQKPDYGTSIGMDTTGRRLVFGSEKQGLIVLEAEPPLQPANRSARAIVDGLFHRLLLKDDVVDQIRGDPKLDDAARQECLRFAESTPEKLDRLKSFVKQTCRSFDDIPDEVVQRASRIAQFLAKRDPMNTNHQIELGVLAFRRREVVESVRLLEQHLKILDKSHNPTATWTLALAYFEMGRFDDAKEWLARFRQIMNYQHYLSGSSRMQERYFNARHLIGEK